MNSLSLKSRLKQALSEDQAFRDITTKSIPHSSRAKLNFKLIAKEKGFFCGAFLLKPVFSLLDRRVRIRIKKKDGRSVRRGEILAEISGRAVSLLAGERLYLNLSSRLSGITTLTRKYVERLKGSALSVFDTRKTTPLWRDLEKFAVRCGGGVNHRSSLAEAILIKDNHLRLIRGLKMTLTQIYGERRKGVKFLEVEAQSYRDVWDALKIRADVIMLDNMPLDKIKGSIVFIKAARKALNSKKPFIEVSGGMTLKKAKALSKLGIDRVSIGALTHSAPALDLSMEVV